MKNQETSYRSDSLTADQKLNYKRCVVQAQDGLTYLFPSESASVAIINPRNVWKSWEDFSARVLPGELESLHQTLFDRGVPAKELKDLTELSVKVWMRLCETSLNRLGLGTSNVRPAAAKLQNRVYEVLSTEVPANIKLPPQARTCLAFFAEQIKPIVDAKVAAGTALADVGIISVSEAEHKAYVIAQAPRLATRQDPWRIFQYYRPQLIQLKLIRMV